MSEERIVLEPEPQQVQAAIEAAHGLDGDARGEALRHIVSARPLCLEGWALLGDHAYTSGDDVAAYAFFRVGYHRGLDLLRAAGWRGSQRVGWSDEPNRGFLRSLHGLMRAAAAIGEGVEARRCRDFLLQLDPDDTLGVEGIRPASLRRRLPDGEETG